MKADMSGARTVPKLLELQEECLAKDLSAGSASSSEDSSDDEVDADVLVKLACLEAPGIPAEVQQSSSYPGAAAHLHHPEVALPDGDAESEPGSDDENSSQSGSDTLEADMGDLKAGRKAHKKAVKEANRERRKHKMPKHVKKKKLKSHKK